MTTRISLEYCGMPGEGRTITEAKADAARKLERLVGAVEREPRVVAIGNEIAIVFPYVEGARYALLYKPEDGSRARLGGGTFEPAGIDEAIRRAAEHLTDLAWSDQVYGRDAWETDDGAFAHQCLAPYVADRRPIVAELCHRWQFHRRYKALRTKGFDDNAAHQIAGGIRRESDFAMESAS